MAPRNPVFLAKARYRQRRLRDALRLLPIVGAVLWLLPLLWQRGQGGQLNSDALIYTFIVWGILVAAGGILSGLLDPSVDGGTEDPAEKPRDPARPVPPDRTGEAGGGG